MKSAERDFTSALGRRRRSIRRMRRFGYLELARADPNAALPYFDRVLAEHGDYVSALIRPGRGASGARSRARGHRAFRAAVAADPSLTDVRRASGSADVPRHRTKPRGGPAGRASEQKFATRRFVVSGLDRRSPDSAFLYRELAAVEKAKGRTDLALEHCPGPCARSDRRSLVGQIGELLERRAAI